jgi:hypothetical protein
VAHADVKRREAEIELWNQRAAQWAQWQAAAELIGPRPQPIEAGQRIDDPLAESGKRPATKLEAKSRELALEVWGKQFERWRELHPAPVPLTPELTGQAAQAIGARPEPLAMGDTMEDRIVTGGQAIFWTESVEPIGEKKLRDVPHAATGDSGHGIRVVRQQYDCPLRGKGNFRVDFLLYDVLGLDLTKMPKAALQTLRLPTRVILPFIVMILLSLITPPVEKEPLDRFYVKMKTPVDPDPEADRRELEASYADPTRFEDKRLVKAFGLEFQRFSVEDIVGFVVCFLICFALIWVTIVLANLGV